MGDRKGDATSRDSSAILGQERASAELKTSGPSDFLEKTRLEDIKILLVEDDGVDVEAMRREIARRPCGSIQVASDGIEALEVLRGGPGRAALRRPFVILLDLNMPRMNGIEFLKALRNDVQPSDSIVFVLTTSEAERDRMAACELHVAGYLIKSKVSEDLARALSLFESFAQKAPFHAG